MSSACFTYTLRQLATRDEIVFKSVVGVLQGKTRHAWQHTPAEDADLVVVGTQGNGPATATVAAAEGHAVIRVAPGSAAVCDAHSLSLPLRIADVITCLDQAGDEIANRVVRPAPTAASPLPAVREQAATPRLALTRWPDSALLRRDVRYLKLATLMTGQPLTLADLAARAQMPLAVCHGFIEDLKAGALLRLVSDAAATPATPRRATPQAPLAPQGLLARIRARLEMIVRAPHVK